MLKTRVLMQIRQILPFSRQISQRFAPFKALNSLNHLYFSDRNERDPPKGFEKFKRERKTPESEEKGAETQEKPQEFKPTEQKKEKEREKKEEKPEEKEEKKEQSFAETMAEAMKQYEAFKKAFIQFNKRFKLGPRQYLTAFIFLSLSCAFLFYWMDPFNTITYEEFLELFSQERIIKIQMNRKIDGSFFQTYAKILLSNNECKTLTLGNIDHFLEKLENIQKDKGKSSDTFIPVEFNFNGDPYKDFDRFSHLIYVLTTGVLILYIIRSSPLTKGKQGLSKTKIFGVDTNIKVKFRDVAGLDEAKVEINEFVDFLKRPYRYREMGARLPKGALLSGPPGTGKTMLAKACAGEAGVPFLYLSGSDFVEMFVGVGASRVRDLFKQAKEKSPSIIFIDEIDAVGKKREAGFGGHDERDNTLNQLLVEMDGFGTDVNVVVLAATNKKEVLDSALTRPGRFDRMIEVNLPDIEGRKEIFMVHLRNLKLDPSKTMEEYAKRLATLTPGFSGADIANLCNEAAILAARKDKTFVESIDFELSSERVMAGLERRKLISSEEKKTVAYHESGHAVVSWFLEGGSPLLKLTIIPRSKGSLGYAQYLPNESSLETKEELEDKIACILGGRCSEELFFGRVTTGAADDLQKAYSLATAMVSKLGMSERLGYIAFKDEEFVKKHSEETQNVPDFIFLNDSVREVIDEEISAIIEKATMKAREIVKKYRVQIESLAKSLIEKETLDLDAIVGILGERPFQMKENFRAYLESKKLA